MLSKKSTKRLKETGADGTIFPWAWFRSNLAQFVVLAYILGHTVDNMEKTMTTTPS